MHVSRNCRFYLKKTKKILSKTIPFLTRILTLKQKNIHNILIKFFDVNISQKLPPTMEILKEKVYGSPFGYEIWKSQIMYKMKMKIN